MGWLFRRGSATAAARARNMPPCAAAGLATLAGVGMVLRSAEGVLYVRRLVPGSAAEGAGIRPGDCVIEVDGTKLNGNDLGAATRAILGPIGSVARIKLVRLEGAACRKFVLLVVRELRATAEPEYKLQGGSDRCTTQFLHLECLQATTERGQRREGAPEAHESASPKDDLCEPESGIKPCAMVPDAVERTAADDAAVDCVLQGCDLKMRKGKDSWSRVHARALHGGKLSLRTAAALGKRADVSSEQCMWCGAIQTPYTPRMSAKEFEEIGRKFYIMVEDGHLFAHGSDGAVSATQGKRFEFLAESEKQRDAWIRAINLLVGANGDSSSGLVAGPANDGSVTVRRVPLPQLRRKQPVHSSPGAATETLPKIAAEARRAATAALDANDGELQVATLVEQTLPKVAAEARRAATAALDVNDGDLHVATLVEQAALAAQTSDAVQAIEAVRRENEGDPTPTARPEDGHSVQDTVSAETTMAVEMNGAATEDDGAAGEEEENETDRLAGIAMSRIASFEAAAQPRAEAEAAQPNLEALWQKTAQKFSSSSHLLDSSAGDASPPTVQKMAGGKDLGGILAARRKAQEQSADDGYYF